jgi:voltage-gated potassium channel
MKPSDEQIVQMKQSLSMFRIIVIAFVAVVLIGTIFFHIIEKWDWLDSIYFVIVTIATVGYGNLVPVTDVGKIGNIILIIVGIGIFGVFVNQLVKYQGLRRIERMQRHNDKKRK